MLRGFSFQSLLGLLILALVVWGCLPATMAQLPSYGTNAAHIIITSTLANHTISFSIAVINPNAANNPPGSGFPGFRGSQQLVLYTPAYEQPFTGTNEFGYEVTVVNGVVVSQEGANSAIPSAADPATSFIASGHGRAKEWLIQHAPIGAKLSLDSNNLVSQVDAGTYLYQLQHRLAEVSPLVKHVDKDMAKTRIQRIQTLISQSPGSPQAITEAQEGLQQLNQAVWRHMPAFQQQAIKGAWHRPVETSVASIDQTLDRLKQAGFNAVFLETFFHGYTIFPSRTYQTLGLDTPNPKFANTGFDLLQTWLTEAHKKHMAIHIWFQTFYGGTTAYRSPGPILRKFPDWANVQRSALDNHSPTPSTVEGGHFFLDPANPKVRHFLLDLLAEIADRYPVDGIQLDYIRYGSSFPADRYSYLKTTWGYTAEARQQFQAQTGVDPATLTPDQTELWQQWMSFKTQLITSFVKEASTSIRSQHPNILISAAVFPGLEDSLIKKHQDWAVWAKNGWVDFLSPMTLTSAIKVVGEDTQRMITQTDGKVPVVAGVFGPFNNNTAAHVLDQVRQARSAGASGICMFDTAHMNADMLAAFHMALDKN